MSFNFVPSRSATGFQTTATNLIFRRRTATEDVVLYTTRKIILASSDRQFQSQTYTAPFPIWDGYRHDTRVINPNLHTRTYVVIIPKPSWIFSCVPSCCSFPPPFDNNSTMDEIENRILRFRPRGDLRALQCKENHCETRFYSGFPRQ